MKTKNAIYDKSFNFAISIVKLYKYLKENKEEYIMSKQLMRSGTSIGANVSEAIQGQSRRDFVHKLQISLKEAYESKYWINLLTETGYLSKIEEKKLLDNLLEIIKLLVSIINTTKKDLE